MYEITEEGSVIRDIKKKVSGSVRDEGKQPRRRTHEKGRWRGKALGGQDRHPAVGPIKEAIKKINAKALPRA